jgi:HEAT repeat protein
MQTNLSASAPNDYCPCGKVRFVSHMCTGPVIEAREELKEWSKRVKDRTLAERIDRAFIGQICSDDGELVKALKKFATSGSPHLRSAAVRVLSYLGKADARRLVRRALHDSSSIVRLEALGGVYLVCDSEALSTVRRLATDDPSEEVLEYARLVADQMKGTPPCVPMPGLGLEEQ